MAEKSNESTTHSPDTINVLPILSDAKAPVSVTLSIDKSVSKVAGWVLIVLFANALLMGGAIMGTVWMVIEYNQAQREMRLQRLETDEMNVRLEKAGIPRHDKGDSP